MSIMFLGATSNVPVLSEVLILTRSPKILWAFFNEVLWGVFRLPEPHLSRDLPEITSSWPLHSHLLQKMSFPTHSSLFFLRESYSQPASWWTVSWLPHLFSLSCQDRQTDRQQWFLLLSCSEDKNHKSTERIQWQSLAALRTTGDLLKGTTNQIRDRYYFAY